MYAGSSMHYCEMVKKPRWEDMDIEYGDKENMFSFMGIGRHLCQSEVGREKGIDPSPYCTIERVDPRMRD